MIQVLRQYFHDPFFCHTEGPDHPYKQTKHVFNIQMYIYIKWHKLLGVLKVIIITMGEQQCLSLIMHFSHLMVQCYIRVVLLCHWTNKDHLEAHRRERKEQSQLKTPDRSTKCCRGKRGTETLCRGVMWHPVTKEISEGKGLIM